jgi:prephenate dehydratase
MKKTTVSFQGEYGAFSETAVLSYFGARSVPVPRPSFRDVFDDVRSHRTTAGIIPIENSLFGSIAQNYDLLREYPLSIAGEITIRIHHCLMALPGTALTSVRHVYSHPQAIGQCDRFLRGMKRTEVHQFYDTAGAAKMIAEEYRTDAAAIAGEQAARHYGLTILKKNVETDHRNFTRFLVLSRTKSAPKRTAKTSLLFTTRHLPGSLVHCLSAFADRQINIEKIESRPIIGSPWEYFFFLDIDAGDRSAAFAPAIRELRKHTTSIKILGSYRRGKVKS